MPLPHDERIRRLRSMLNQVAGSDGLESLSPPKPGGSYEALADGGAQPNGTVDVALQKLKSGQPISPVEASALEAIVLPDKRPVVFIRKGIYDAVPMEEWKHLNAPAVHGRLDPLMGSIGRIELPTTPSIPYGGTGFVVGTDLLMTNRHVARLFTDGLGTHLTYRAGGGAVDFQREIEPPSGGVTVLKVMGVLMIHPYWDMALLKVNGLPPSAKPLPLSVLAPEDLLGQDVVVVGYPARDYRNDFDVQDRVFQRQYGVKRMAPGKAQKRDRIESFETIVNAMTHDSSTLGGNSGSAIIHVQSGAVVGLHFAGEYLKANYSVPTFELARDPKVVDAGLNFQGTVPSTTEFGSAWAHADNGGETASPLPPSPTASLSAPSAAATAVLNFSLPIQVTIAVGAPTTGQPASGLSAAVPTVAAGALPAAEIEKVPVIYPDMDSREGYREDFLELADGEVVPLPQLTSAGKASAARLDDGSFELKYHKFSIVIHKRRRLALFTAANVDWRPQTRSINGDKPSRKELDGFTGNEREDWVIDGRIPLDNQLPDYFYTKDQGAFDKGHLVRRDDVAWGETFEDMQKANGDTFHTTNCSPQTAEFNRPAESNWGALEQMVQKQTNAERVCVFSGPVLDDSDEYFHGLIKSGVSVSVQIPNKFWKIIVAKNNGQPAAFGFVLDQDLSGVDLYAEMTVPDAWKDYLRPIAEIEGFLSGLAKLTTLMAWDQYDHV
jgi:endonuclease G, mitochondrial